MEHEKPKGFVKNVENIWYHYKAVILIGSLVLIMAIVATVQFVTKKEPDIFAYHVSTHGLTAMAQDDFRESMKVLAKDYNGDGTVKVDYKEEIYIPHAKKSNPDELMSVERFNLELALGECVLYFMDESYYKGNREYMSDLEDVLGYVPAFAFDEKAVKLSDLPATAKLAGLQYFGDDIYVCLRKPRTGMDEQMYQAHVDFFKNLMLYA